MSQDSLPIRPSVTAFAATSFALKAALVLLLLAPMVIPAAIASPSLLVALLAAVIASTLVRSLVVQRLSATELAVLQYWSITPLLILLLAAAIGMLPILVLDQLRAWLHWSDSALQSLIAFAMIGSLISAAIVVWSLWKQFRASLLTSAR